jgi:AAA domain
MAIYSICVRHPKAAEPGCPDCIKGVSRVMKADLRYVETQQEANEKALRLERARENVRAIKARELLPVIRFTSIADVLSRPDVQWLIPGWLPAKGIGLVHGEEYAGKSMITLALAGSFATGIAFLSQPVSKTGQVLMCLGEGQDGLPQRLRSMIAGHLHGEVPDIRFMETPFPVTTESARLLCTRIGEDKLTPGLIIFDAKMDFLSGEENSNTDAEALVRCQKLIRDYFDCPVIIVDHSGNDNSERNRGASRLRQAQEFRWHVATGSVTCKKSKESGIPPPLCFEIQPVPETASATVFPVSASEQACKGDAEDRFTILQIIRDSPDDMTTELLRKLRKVLKVSQNETSAYLKALVKSGMVVPVKGRGNAITYKVSESLLIT